ncbi:MAG: hypothetical protein K1Y36_16615 [Blastocatellia bacterium]|nr:hypothetical protein [Blastocatellia bacterium]
MSKQQYPMDLYRQPEFPAELLEQGWQAEPAAWNPPPRLRTKVMESFDQEQERKLTHGWWRAVTADVRIPVPLAVTTAGLVISFGTWSVLQEPQVVVLTTSHLVPGPAVTIPVAASTQPQSGERIFIPVPAVKGKLSDRVPVMRGETAKPIPTLERLNCVRLIPGKLRLVVDEVEVAVTRQDEEGTALWVQNGQAGGFILTLFPVDGTKAQPIGTLDGKIFAFEHEGLRYQIQCDRPLITGAEPFTVWVQFVPPTGNNQGFAVGCAENPAKAVDRLEQPPPLPNSAKEGTMPQGD